MVKLFVLMYKGFVVACGLILVGWFGLDELMSLVDCVGFD
jgi:hypothetical protein